jgi:hypothetical protein
MKEKCYNIKQSDGYLILLSVMIIGAIALAVVVSMLLSGLGTAKTSLAHQQSVQAKALANACINEALQQIRDSTAFTGSNNLSLGQGTCTYTVTNTGGENRTIQASSTVGLIIRKTQATVTQINPSITIASWQEVSAF